ncbi:COX15/CtaA family protein [bacterium]|jgi:heme A synthase|nr:COX15/CtaA family protein [Acidimicrobiia bacterium]MDA9645600.1 COX15/CtaA family protein [Candidatus Actinomarina sp.]MDA9681535.1 COX15/CtaA family protein [bacterium]|tara:strand:- start:1456 stop:2343 length:888 start_codon:yes stop_codon:yes gene_type:complete
MTLFNLSRSGLILSIFSIIAGAVVRATGSGDGCGSSWPTCNGRVIPSLNSASEQIEFSHRAISGLLLIVTIAIFIKSFNNSVTGLQKKVINYLTFFVILEALIGAVIVLYEWVGMNSSIPRIAAVPLHLVNTFGLLAMYTIIFKLTQNPEIKISNLIDRKFKIITFLFILTGATGSIAALADVLFPSESFIAGIVEDFDSTSEILTRLRVLHPIVSTVLSFVLFNESKRLEDKFNLKTNQIKILVIIGVTLGVLNVFININIFLSVVHLLVADLLWITYIYTSMQKSYKKSLNHK